MSNNSNNNSSNNNNPQHGHITQQPTPNPSWNPLQIPSYIPRQPQLAHMSNERPMVRSPLTWHAPAPPPDAIYNFMSANHKNLEHHQNPLLPPYVRGPSPFDSMDLSLQSSRSASSPLNKGGVSAGAHAGMSSQHDYGAHKQQQQQQQQHSHPQQHQPQSHQQQQQQQQQQSQMHAPNNFPIHNLSTNSPSTIAHSQQHASMSAPAPQHPHGGGGGMQSAAAAPPPSSSPAAATSAAANAKYLNSNGNDCETMLPPASAAGSTVGGAGSSVSSGPSGTTASGSNNNNTPIGPSSVPQQQQQHYMREADAARLGESYAEMSQMSRSYESKLQSKSMQKPVELVSKDCSYPAVMSNKMTPHQQQVSPKKHSPLRNYHAHQQQQQLQQQQQQQQQHSPYNNPPAVIKRNGPHTPPMPQSPVMHQQQQPAPPSLPQQQQPTATTNTAQQQMQQHPPTMHGNNAVMDYNQLHLQQQNSYTHHQQHQQQQQQQQQQHLPPHLQQQHLQHYAHHHHHHLQQQQHHTQQHLLPQQHAPQHPQQQQQHFQQHHSPMHQQQHQQQQQQQQHSHLTNLDGYPPAASRNESKGVDSLADKPTITDLTAATPPRNYLGSNVRDSSCLPDTAESPDTAAAASSNEESLDSNSNSSGLRLRRMRKQPKILRLSSNESFGEGEELREQRQQPPPTTSCSNTRSPKASPEQQRKSPKKTDSNSPPSSHPSPGQFPATGAPEPQRPSSQSYLHSPEKAQSLKNGRPSAAVAPADEVETIDKIAEMIAKTSSEASSSYSSFKNNEPPPMPPDLAAGSPKTKKQRQALKLRNAAEHNSNSNCSAHSYNEIAVAASASDNAVLAEELRKDDDVVNVAATVQSTTPHSSLAAVSEEREQLTTPVRPLSPQSNSRSSSSSSSSSSRSSNSSHSSSNVSKLQKAKTAIVATTTARDENAPVFGSPHTSTTTTMVLGKENMREGVIQAPLPMCPNNNNNNNNKNRDAITEEDGEHEQVPLNLNNKKSEECVVETSPTKSACFEEVENKLEEMFAGIEDEPAAPPHDDDVVDDEEDEDQCRTTHGEAFRDSAEMVNDLSLALELAKETKKKKNLEQKDSTEIVKTLQQPPPTKAAKKSTVPSPVKPTTPPPASPSPPVQKKPTSPPPQPTPPLALPKRITPPRRRLSVVMDPANFRITIEPATKEKKDTEKRPITKREAEATNKELILQLDDERPSTSAAAAAALAAKETDSSGSKTTEKTTRGGGTTARKAARGGGHTKAKRGGGAAGNSLTKSGAGKQKQQTQKQRRRKCASSSEDETIPLAMTVSRELPPPPPPSADSKYKSPFILVKRDGSISVINAPTAAGGGADDIGGEKNKSAKAKKAAAAYAHDRRNIRGLHSSTLSNRYDADTTDSTWICVFCKHGPHKLGLGDLFGPYLVSIECAEYRTAVCAPDALDLDAAFVSKRRRIDMVQHNPRNLPVVPATLAAQQQQQQALRVGMNKKKKKSIDEPSLSVTSETVADPLDCRAETLLPPTTFRGMCKVSDSSYEVWLHEDCIVWAPDVFLVGARVMGLDAAVWSSTLYQCVLCGKAGAIVCCLQRDCKAPAHVPCARAALWCLNEATLKVHCHRHAAVLKSPGTPTSHSSSRPSVFSAAPSPAAVTSYS